MQPRQFLFLLSILLPTFYCQNTTVILTRCKFDILGKCFQNGIKTDSDNNITLVVKTKPYQYGNSSDFYQVEKIETETFKYGDSHEFTFNFSTMEQYTKPTFEATRAKHDIGSIVKFTAKQVEIGIISLYCNLLDITPSELEIGLILEKNQTPKTNIQPWVERLLLI